MTSRYSLFTAILMYSYGLQAGQSIVGASNQSYAIRDDGRVAAWGWNIGGALDVPSNLTNCIALSGSAGGIFCLGLDAQRRIFLWGTTNSNLCAIPEDLTNAVDIAAGMTHCLAITRDGLVRGWGYNTSGQATPPSSLSNVIAIAASTGHSLALDSYGHVTAWGSNIGGATTVPSNLSNVVNIAAGKEGSLALRSDGSLIVWGSVPTPPVSTGVVAIAANYMHYLQLLQDGTVRAWGLNYDGQANVPGTLSNVVAIAAGGFHSMALTADGTLVCWGGNAGGQTDPPANSWHVPFGMNERISHIQNDAPADHNMMTFKSERGRIYRLMSSVDLEHWQADMPYFHGRGEEQDWLFHTNNSGRRFYRLQSRIEINNEKSSNNRFQSATRCRVP